MKNRSPYGDTLNMTTISGSSQNTQSRDSAGEDVTHWQDLANAIVLKAVEDYRAARAILARNPYDPLANSAADDALRFFRSAWFGTLTRINPETLITKLDAEVTL